jgi:hypothetical protein
LFADEPPNIFVAAGDGLLDNVRALVEEGVDGAAALAACTTRRWQPPDVRACLCSCVSDATPPAVNSADDYGYTAMHAASSYGHLDVLNYLLSVGGDVNLGDMDGDTPLHACESVECAARLLEAHANIDAPNHSGRTPLYICLKDGREDMVKFLVSRGAAPIDVPEGGFVDSDDDDAGDDIDAEGFDDDGAGEEESKGGDGDGDMTA